MASPDELWLVDFGDPYPGEPSHHRPALIVGSVALFGPNFPFVFVVPLTTTHRNLSLHVEIEAQPNTGLDMMSYAQCELIRSINARRLVHQMGTIDTAVSHQVSKVLKALLGM